MRILFVTDFYDPYVGGVEIHVKSVAEALAARGHRVGVATLPTGPDQPPRPTGGDPDGGPVEVFPVDHLTARLGRGFANAARPWAPPLPDPLAMSELRRVVSSFRPDVIHGHDWLARSALPRLVSRSVPVVTTLHYYTRTCAKKTRWYRGAPCPGPNPMRCLRCAGDHYGSARGTVIAVGTRLGAALEDRRSARHLSVSAATAIGNGLPAGGDGRSAVVANPLSASADQPADTVPDGVPAGPFIAYVGDLRPEKGVHVLVDAVARLRRHHGNDTPLVLVGEPTMGRLDLPPATVELGPVDHDVVQAIWRRATIGVVPSLWPEPFGLVAIEAMAAGCPLVASDIGGLAEILAPDPATGAARGVLVAAGDHVALARAIDELGDDPERRRAMAEAARRSLDRYDLDAIVDAIEAEYRLVTGGAA